MVGLLSVLFLKRKFSGSQLFGMAAILTGLSLVGISAARPTWFFGEVATAQGKQQDEKIILVQQQESKSVLLGICLILIAQFMQGLQYTWEEYLLKAGTEEDQEKRKKTIKAVPPLMLIGIEGCFGTL